MATDNGAHYDPILALAARELFALINKNAPYPQGEEPADHYGPYGGVISEFRMLHRQARDIWARGETCDPWYDAGLLWDGYRQEDGTTIDYAALDELVRKIGGLPPSVAGKVEYITGMTPITGSALMAKEIPPTRHFVQNIIRAGLGFFIGQPGVGKTPALIQLAISFATGGLWFGMFRVPKIRVAYIGPEYDEGDVRSIIMESTGGRADLDNLLIFTIENFVGPKTEEEALQIITDLVERLGVEAIIIDLLPGFLPPEKFKQNAYRGDYKEFLAYHRIALSYGITLIGAWHGTKRDANPATMYNGGQGFWGSAGGGRLVMYQDEEDQVKLYTQLRGNKAVTYTLSEGFIAGCRLWAVLEGSEPEPAFGSDIHRAIYRAVKEHAPSHGLTPKTIAGLVQPELTSKISEAYIRKCISVLVKRGLLHAVGDGYVVKKNGSQGSQGYSGIGEVYEDREDQRDQPSIAQPLSHGLHRDHLVSDPSDPSPIPPRDRPFDAFARAESGSDPSDPSLSSGTTDPVDSDLFARSAPDGLTASQWERARFFVGTARWSELSELARDIPMEYKALKHLVEHGHADAS